MAQTASYIGGGLMSRRENICLRRLIVVAAGVGAGTAAQRHQNDSVTAKNIGIGWRQT